MKRKCLTMFTLVMLGLKVFLVKTEAVVTAPDGGYPGGNTAEGQRALFGLTSDQFNTAVGFWSLVSDTTGSLNTGLGDRAF